MKQDSKQVSLGFTDETFDKGIHICQIFKDDDERQHALEEFILSGLKQGEKTSCFSEKVNLENLNNCFSMHGISMDEKRASGEFTIAGSEDIYFEGNKFDPDKMLEVLKDYHISAEKEGCKGARVIGEMSPKVQTMEGGNRLIEYEAKVSLLLKEYPVNAVCQYDANVFDGGTILEILKVHPYMIIRGKVVQNPFFIPPGEVLGKSDL